MIHIICVGKIKKEFIEKACSDYENRIKKYTKIKITQLQDVNIATEADAQKAMEKEADAILKAISSDDYIIALAIEGKQIDSVEFSQHIERLQMEVKGDITFIIGSSHGLHEKIIKKANLLLSFSKMTFAHQIFRALLLEQIYRAYSIMNNTPYHK